MDVYKLNFKTFKPKQKKKKDQIRHNFLNEFVFKSYIV